MISRELVADRLRCMLEHIRDNRPEQVRLHTIAIASMLQQVSPSVQAVRERVREAHGLFLRGDGHSAEQRLHDALSVLETIGIDSTPLEANAAMKSIVRRNNQEYYTECLKRLAQAETPLLPETQRSEQRSHRRYPMALDLRYEVMSESQITCLGSGRTLNLSSRGILFRAAEPVPEQGLIELVVNWPVLLDSACHLNLIARGRILRSDSNGTAVKVTHYELRTSSRLAAAS